MTLIFRIVAFLEGVSYLLLLGVGMPLKYIWNDASWVQALGMPHGVLFVAYIVLAFLVWKVQKWDLKTFVLVCLASLFPFGTFWVERYKIRKV